MRTGAAGQTGTETQSPTELRNPATVDIDLVPTVEVLRQLNREDQRVAGAVEAVLPMLAQAVDATVARLRAGGRLHYFGAGTSGRIATMDAAEIAPTFGIEPGTVVAHHAGGPAALEVAVEGVEDQEGLGARDAAALGRDDAAVGLSASGRTPYVRGALSTARKAGSLTILMTSNPRPSMADSADIVLVTDTGPEAIAGSTRLKAATAQKLLLNSLSTATMVRLGRTYSNLMVAVVPSNAKLRERLVAILVEATGAGEQACRAAIDAADGDLQVALVSLLAGVPVPRARAALVQSGDGVRAALGQLERGPQPA